MEIAIAVSILVIIGFTLLIGCYATVSSIYQVVEEVYEHCKVEQDKELKRLSHEIADLKDRIWNQEIDLKNHKEDCNFVAVKLDVVEMLEDRIARLEARYD